MAVEPGTRYVVTRIKPCETCGGTGECMYVLGPNGIEYEDCPDCKGTGQVRDEVDLGTVLMDDYGLDIDLR